MGEGGSLAGPAGEVDVDAQLAARGCAGAFEAVQLCLADSGRDWTKCQRQVKEWKACMAPGEGAGAAGAAGRPARPAPSADRARPIANTA